MTVVPSEGPLVSMYLAKQCSASKPCASHQALASSALLYGVSTIVTHHDPPESKTGHSSLNRSFAFEYF